MQLSGERHVEEKRGKSCAEDTACGVVVQVASKMTTAPEAITKAAGGMEERYKHQRMDETNSTLPHDSGTEKSYTLGEVRKLQSEGWGMAESYKTMILMGQGVEVSDLAMFKSTLAGEKSKTIESVPPKLSLLARVAALDKILGATTSGGLIDRIKAAENALSGEASAGSLGSRMHRLEATLNPLTIRLAELEGSVGTSTGGGLLPRISAVEVDILGESKTSVPLQSRIESMEGTLR